MKTYSIQQQEQALFNKIKSIRIEGNVVPLSWYKKLQYESEQRPKPHLLAITLLADFCYWYRPVTDQRDEITGQPLPDTKKFAADLLQRSYGDMAEMYGCTERQAKEAVVFLEERGLVKRHLRTVRGSGGVLANNVLYIEIFPNAIAKITDPCDAVETQDPTPMTLESHTNTIIEELSIDNSSTEPEKPKRTPQQIMYGALSNVTLADPVGAQGYIGKTARDMVKAGYVGEQVEQLFGDGPSNWFYTVYQSGWRQQRRPRLDEIPKLIRQAIEWEKKKQPAPPADQSAVLSKIYENSQL